MKFEDLANMGVGSVSEFVIENQYKLQLIEWVDCYYRKPDKDKCVDLWIDDGENEGRIENYFYDDEANGFWKHKSNFGNHFISQDCITHWMYHPEGPKA